MLPAGAATFVENEVWCEDKCAAIRRGGVYGSNRLRDHDLWNRALDRRSLFHKSSSSKAEGRRDRAVQRSDHSGEGPQRNRSTRSPGIFLVGDVDWGARNIRRVSRATLAWATIRQTAHGQLSARSSPWPRAGLQSAAEHDFIRHKLDRRIQRPSKALALLAALQQRVRSLPKLGCPVRNLFSRPSANESTQDESISLHFQFCDCRQSFATRRGFSSTRSGPDFDQAPCRCVRAPKGWFALLRSAW